MKYLKEAVASLGMELTEEQLRQFEAYRAGVLEWNEKVNLTAITDPEEFEMKHFADSVMSAGSEIMKNAQKIIDVGTGGGFPGIPLAILFPKFWGVQGIYIAEPTADIISVLTTAVLFVITARRVLRKEN